MTSPKKQIILLVGPSDSGKDTVARILSDQCGATIMAFADPMKRFIKDVFWLHPSVLWGPSAVRNKVILKEAYKDIDFDAHAAWWLDSIGVDRSALPSLQKWFGGVLGLYNDNAFSPRVALQTLGTEWGRAWDENLWVNHAQRTIKEVFSGRVDYVPEIGRRSCTGLQDDLLKHDTVVITDGRFPNEILKIKELGGTVIKIVPPTVARGPGIADHPSETAQRDIPDQVFDVTIENDKSLGLESLKEQVHSKTSSLFPDIVRFKL